MKVNVDPNTLDDYKCKCGCDIFARMYKFKRLSKIQSPSGQEMVVESVLTLCSNCGDTLDNAIKHTINESKKLVNILKG